jgi:hypothetical protein
VERKEFKSNHSLRRKKRFWGMHPTVAIANAFIGVAILVVFSIFEWSGEFGFFVFICLGLSLQAVAPDGLGELIVMLLPAPIITRGHGRHESPYRYNVENKSIEKRR